jgi:hypothetical protein
MTAKKVKTKNTKKRGRKELPDPEKQSKIVMFFRNDFIEKLGGADKIKEKCTELLTAIALNT